MMQDNSEDKHILEKVFKVAKRSSKHPQVDYLKKDGLHLQIAFICSILLITILSLAFKKFETDNAPYVPLDFVLQVQDVPETTQSNKTPPPPPRMPAVPVASEIEELLEEMVYEVETLDFIELPQIPAMEPAGASVALGPKPIFIRWPEYPESEVKKGHEGIIDVKIKVNEKGLVTEVEVVKNTTGSKLLERKAVEAAQQSKFQPARDKKNRPITVWSMRQYKFGSKAKKGGT